MKSNSSQQFDTLAVCNKIEEFISEQCSIDLVDLGYHKGAIILVGFNFDLVNNFFIERDQIPINILLVKNAVFQ